MVHMALSTGYSVRPERLFLCIMDVIGKTGIYRVTSLKESQGFIRAERVPRQRFDNTLEFHISVSDGGETWLKFSILDSNGKALMRCEDMVSAFKLYGVSFRPATYITFGRISSLIRKAASDASSPIVESN
jgi:hypothetical protein